MAKVSARDFERWRKCPGCGWQVSRVYSFPGHDAEAEGLCASCFLDMIVEEGMDVVRVREGKRRW